MQEASCRWFGCVSRFLPFSCPQEWGARGVKAIIVPLPVGFATLLRNLMAANWSGSNMFEGGALSQVCL